MIIDSVEEYSINQLRVQFKELRAYCEKNEDVSNFVNLLLTCTKYNSFDKSVLEKVASDELHQLLYEITKYDFCSAITNQYHFKGSWVYMLNSFISNYFYDDCGFVVEHESQHKTWNARSSSTTDIFLQDPRILVEAAYDNARFYHSDLKTLLTTSGNVERLLTRVIGDQK
jgi:hypothetical protein